jgi:hypothetical protein
LDGGIGMNNNENVGMIEKAIENTPDWLMEDIEKIEKKRMEI